MMLYESYLPGIWYAIKTNNLLQGIMLVYDITQSSSFGNINKWLRNIEDVSMDLEFLEFL